MVTAEQIKDIKGRVEELRKYLEIDKKLIQIQNEQEKTHDPSFWNNAKEAEKFMKGLNGKKKWVADFEAIRAAQEDVEVLFDFYKEGEATAEELQTQFDAVCKMLEDVEFKNMLSGEEDSLAAVLQITAGAGGTESNDWASMLMRMYLMWGNKFGAKVKELNFQEGDVAGVKTVTLEFDAEYAFGYLKGENGVHRLVRISPFDSNAKRHTSFVSVYVYPLVDDSIEIHVNPADVSWETMRSSGAGGQNVNKVETAVRLRYNSKDLEHEIIIENSETRSQLDNKTKAMQLLKSQLYEIELQKKLAKREQIEANKMKIEWGSQIRNYVLQPYKLVKDVRTGFETSNTDAILDGEIDDMLKSYLMMMGQRSASASENEL